MSCDEYTEEYLRKMIKRKNGPVLCKGSSYIQHDRNRWRQRIWYLSVRLRWM